jgi:hypothetical protein
METSLAASNSAHNSTLVYQKGRKIRTHWTLVMPGVTVASCGRRLHRRGGGKA